MFHVTDRPIAVRETCWTIHEIINREQRLKLRITIQHGRKTDYDTKLSKQYIINDAVSFQLRMDSPLSINNFKFDSTSKKEEVILFCKFENVNPENNQLYCAYVICSYNDVHKTFCVDDTWRIILENKLISKFDMTIFVDKINRILQPFAPLYPDSESADLKLMAADGYIKLHSTVLIAYSPIFKKELCEKQREQCQPYELTFLNLRQSTLQLLKEYLYLKNVPDSSLSSLMDLMQFSCKYKMKELHKLCMQNLINHVNAENFYQLIEFAQNNKLGELYLSILELIANSVIETKDIKKHICQIVNNDEEIEVKC